jgi:energy-converting hydrogenase Eha subunit C
MTTQVVNALFHAFFSFYFLDFSPGAITGVLLYLPVNYFIFKAALREGLIGSKKEIGYLFVLGASTFALFELIGPQVMLSALILSVIYYLIASKREAFNT